MRKTLLRNGLLAAAILAGMAHGTGARADLLIIGGETNVEVTAAGALTDAGLTLGVLGSATATAAPSGNPLVTFPITGGVIFEATGAALIEHDGSGLSLFDGTTTLELRDFLINTELLTLFGNAIILAPGADPVSLAGVPLFSIGSGLELLLTTEGAGALTTVFGLPDLTGLQIGVAAVNPQVVPEPSSVVMLLTGLAGAGYALRRRRAQA